MSWIKKREIIPLSGGGELLEVRGVRELSPKIAMSFLLDVPHLHPSSSLQGFSCSRFVLSFFPFPPSASTNCGRHGHDLCEAREEVDRWKGCRGIDRGHATMDTLLSLNFSFNRCYYTFINYGWAVESFWKKRKSLLLFTKWKIEWKFNIRTTILQLQIVKIQLRINIHNSDRRRFIIFTRAR